MTVLDVRACSWARRWLGLVLGVALLQLLVPAAPSEAARCRDRGDSSFVPATGAVFNDPTGRVRDQYRILSTVVRSIDATPPGEEVRIASLAIKAPSVVTALQDAHACRVRVRVLVPGRAWEDAAVLELRRTLGTDLSASSYVTRCTGTCTTRGTDGVMHVKSYLFSKVGRVGPVTMYSSSNLTRGQATMRWNDAYLVVGDEPVYDSATRWFDTLVLDEEVRYPRLTKAAGYWQYSFPAEEDFHLGLFEQTRCHSSLGATQVAFVASIWTQVAVAEKVADLHDAGCEVRVLLSIDKVERAVLDTLESRGVPTRVQSTGESGGANHSKYLAIRGMHDDYVVRTVYTGSANVSRYSTRTANNNMLRIVDDPAAHRAYRRAFDRLWEGSRPLGRSDVAAAGTVDDRAAERRD